MTRASKCVILDLLIGSYDPVTIETRRIHFKEEFFFFAGVLIRFDALMRNGFMK